MEVAPWGLELQGQRRPRALDGHPWSFEDKAQHWTSNPWGQTL